MKALYLFTLITIFHKCNAQDFSANYSVIMTWPNYNLNYNAKYFASGNKVAHYLEPLFVGKYPDNILKIKGVSYSIPIDSIQDYTVVDLDSSIIWYMPVIGPANKFKFEPNYFYWQINPETKIINNLICQKANFYNYDGGRLLGELWFCPDIPMPSGLFMVQNIPGLMVELDFFGTGRVSLINFSFGEKIDPIVFWPPKFNNLKFKDGGTWRKSSVNSLDKKRKNSDAEIQNIMKQ